MSREVVVGFALVLGAAGESLAAFRTSAVSCFLNRGAISAISSCFTAFVITACAILVVYYPRGRVSNRKTEKELGGGLDKKFIHGYQCHESQGTDNHKPT